MAGNIKGITVEIGGNTTPLNEALQGVNKQAKDLQKELGFVEKALKIDPKNVELLTQKQELLRESVSNTAEKLDVLKQAQKKLDDEMQAGLEVDAEQYRQLQRQIVFTEDKLEGLTTELKNFGSVGAQQIAEVGKQMQDVGGKITEAGKGFSVISAGAGAALTAATTQAVSLEGAVNKYVASTGKSIEETEKFEEVLTNIFSKGLGESMDDIGNKMGIVTNLLGDLPTDQLESITEKSLRLQQVYDMDFQENIRGLDAMMSQFGITADEALELINQGAQNGLNQNKDWTDQIAEYAVHWADLGFTAEDMLNKLIAGSQDGAFQIDYLNDAMKEFGIKVLEDDEKVSGAFTTLGLNAETLKTAFAQGGDAGREAFSQVAEALNAVDDPLKQNEIGVTLFGTKFEDLGATAILAMGSAEESVDMLGDSLDKTSEIMDSGTGASFEQLTRDIQLLGAELGQVLLPIIQPLVDGLRGMVQSFSEMSPTAQTVIVTILGIVTAIGPLLIVIGNIITAVGTIMTIVPQLVGIFNTVKTAMVALNAVMAANPVGAIILAITALIAIFVTLYNKCDWFRNGVNAIWDGIKTAFFAAWDAITNFFTVTIPEVFNTVINFVKDNWQGLLLLIVNPFAGAFKLLYDNCDAFRNFVDNFVQNVKDFFVNGWNSIVEFFTESIPAWFDSLKTWFGELPYKLGLLIGQILGKVIQFGIDVVEWIKTNVPMFIENVIKFVKELPGKVWTWLVETFNKIVQFGVDTLNKAIEVGSKFLETIVNYVKELPGKIWTWLKNTITKINTWIADMKKKGKEAIKGLIDNIIEGAKEIPSKMLEIGKNIVSGVWNGILDAKDTFVSNVKGFFSGIVDGVKESLGIESPSKVFKREVGYWIPAGVAEGIDENAGVVGESLSHMLDASNVGLDGFNSQGGILNTMRGVNGSHGYTTSNNYGQNTVNIYADSIDTQNIDKIVDVINRRLGVAY
ncbi:MAG: phage tail tape measure protein [Clostridia bacterium]|nr:phage tail tape measure protein [Clostridia bacterium]